MARPYLRGDQCARRRQTRPPHWRHATAHGKALALTISLTFLGRADEVMLSGADTRSAHGLDRSSNSSCLQSSRSCKPTSHSGRRPSTAGRRAAASRMPATARCMSPSPKSRFRRSRRGLQIKEAGWQLGSDAMAQNLLRDTWAGLDQADLRLLLQERIGRPGQYDGNLDVLYLPLAREKCRVSLTYKGTTIAAMEPGAAFDPAEWERICAEIEGPILQGLRRIGREFSFSTFRVEGWWRGTRSGVQILPPPDGAPRPPPRRTCR
jgi:hypothetical protein